MAKSSKDASTAAPSRPALAEQLVELSALTGGLAHEIRNPLSTLKVNLQLLDEDWQRVESSAGPSDCDPREIARRSRRRIESLVREADRLERILEDFLIYVGKRELKRALHDLNDVVSELVDFYRPQAEANRIELNFAQSPEPLLCNIDAALIKQAVLNLLINAQQAMSAGGTLRLSLGAEPPGRIRLDVEDSGPGIPRGQQPHIFQAYYSTKKAGTGLGLATTRQIVLEHGGEIRLQSDPPAGARFTILLPRAG